MKLGNWPKFTRSCTYNPFLSQGLEIELIFALRAAVSEIRIRADIQNCLFGHETSSLPKDPDVAHILSFYRRGS